MIPEKGVKSSQEKGNEIQQEISMTRISFLVRRIVLVGISCPTPDKICKARTKLDSPFSSAQLCKSLWPSLFKCRVVFWSILIDLIFYKN